MGALLAAAVAAGPAAATTHAVKGAAAARVTHVIVKATEFRFALSTRRVPVGTVVFTVENEGKIAHDFEIDGKKTPVIAAGKSATLRVVFRRKGVYRYLCTVPGHAAAGMKGALAVGPV